MTKQLSIGRGFIVCQNLLCVLCLVLSGAAQASVTYTFSGLSSIFEPSNSDVLQTFSITVPTFITADTTYLVGDPQISSCNSAVDGCAGVHFAIPGFSPGYDVIDFKTPSTGTFYYFFAGSFGAAGTYTSQLGFHPATLNVVTNAVPEPETYAMMLAGLGLLGFSARRRKQQTS